MDMCMRKHDASARGAERNRKRKGKERGLGDGGEWMAYASGKEGVDS